MRRYSFSYLLITALLLLCFCFFDIKLIAISILLTIFTFYPYIRRLDYTQNETENAKTHYQSEGFEPDLSDYDRVLSSSKVEDNLFPNNFTKPLSDDHLVNSFFETPSIMWSKRPVSNSKEGSPISKPLARMKLNSTLPVMTSPMSTRLRSRKPNFSENVTSVAGPLLSSPFIPQIKRALGLEPSSPQTKYGLSRRHSLHVPPSLTTPSPAGTLPHVRLNRSRRTSLSDRNTSMLNRSSTVKIAPPTPGKVASPSLYHMRADVSVAEDRSTPDTYAVVNALKERRKRSINYEETAELPMHQAKRRRQESQQSNASTSSLPGPPMPDNLPDLSNPSFALRMETPGPKRPSRPSQDTLLEWDREQERPVKRPSRPSQDTSGEWDRDQEGRVKRLRSETRNNSILSSLSSSRRFAEKQIENQSKKRKADKSFHGKENETSQSKIQKTDTLILPREDTLSGFIKKKPELSLSKADTILLSNGYTDKSSEKQGTSQTPTKPHPSRSPLLKNMTSMKKSATVYSGLATKESFPKAQFANVVATAADYDSDRETEQKRVKQILQDLDDSFNKDEAKSPELLTTDSKTTAITTSITSLANITTAATATSAITITTSGVTIATSTQPSVLSSLTSLSQLVKSPVQESSAGQETKSVSESTDTSVSTTTTSATTSPKFKPLFGPVTTTASSSGAPATDTKPGGFSFGLTTAATSQPTASTGVVQPTSLGAPPPYPFGSTVSSASASTVGTASSVTSVPSVSTGSSSNFSFGLAQTKTETVSQPSLPVSATSVTSTTPSGFGLSSATQAPSASAAGGFALTSTGGSTGANFSFGASSSATTSVTSAGDFSFGQIPSTISTTGAGLSFGQTPSTISTTGPGFSFGQTPSTTTSAGLSFGQTPSTMATSAGFSFGQTPSTTTAVTTATSAGFSFGQTPSTSSAAFSFGQTPVSQPSSSGPSFGQSTAVSGTGGFAFGQAPSVTTSATGFSFGQGLATTSSATGFSFGQAPTTVTPFGQSTASTGISFGQGSTTTTASSGGFSFGTNLSTSQPSAAPGMFGNTSATPATTVSGFGFGGAGSTSLPAFGNPAATQASTGLAFGASSGTPAGAFSFGANTGATTMAPSQPFQFGANPVTSSGFSFGTTTSSAAPAFGTVTSSAPAFGAPSGSSAFTFGSGSSGMGATATPFQTNTPASSASGLSFGQNTTGPVFAFGAASTSAPVFGASNTSVPAFGSNPQSAPVFGSAAGQTGQPSVLGGAKSNTPVFGASHSQNSTPVFGSSANPAPAFGQKSLTPTFGASTNNNAGFSFGQQPAPNVNPFGQTTPAKQTGSAFGQTGLDSTPQQQTGPVFQFGQSGAQQASTSVKGFDFSGAAGASGFNFSAGGTPGAFGTPSGTPTGTPTPGGFNLGSNPRPPRIVTKARRRTARK